MNLMAEHEYRIEGASDRVWRSLMHCLRLPFSRPAFQYQIGMDGKNDHVISLSDTMYGSFGRIVATDLPYSQTLISFIEPGYPDFSEVAKYLPQLLQTQPNLPAGIRLALMLDQSEIVADQMRPILHRIRCQLHREIKEWLFNRLRIFGFRSLISQIPSSLDPEAFLFPIQATCSQVAVLARHIAREWEEKGDIIPGCLVQDPDTLYAVGNVIPDSEPLNIIFSKKNASMKILIHLTSATQSLMKVIMMDREENWNLWDILRNEMERAGYIQVSDTALCESLEQELDHKELDRENLVKVPEKGDHLRIVQLWHAGKTAKDIARQTGRTEKTILNLLAVLRKEFGEAAVPRRR